VISASDRDDLSCVAPAVALTTALSGAGGYGKTMLANYLCRDDDVRFEFSDGIIRVEVGKERNDMTGLVIDLIEKLDSGGKRPGFQDATTASEHLGEVLGEARILLVIDDVWREAQLRPFLRGGPNCVRLVTTRLPQVLPRGYVTILIDQMRTAEAASLIAMNLPVDASPATRARLVALANRLGNWAQMLIPKLTDQNSFASWVLNVSAVRPGGIGSGQWVLVLASPMAGFSGELPPAKVWQRPSVVSSTALQHAVWPGSIHRTKRNATGQSGTAWRRALKI